MHETREDASRRVTAPEGKERPPEERRATELGIPYVELSSTTVDEQIVDVVPERIARRLGALPLFRIENSLSVAMVDPTDVLALDELRRITGCTILPSLCSAAALEEAFNRWYRVDADVRQMVETIAREEPEEDAVVRAHGIDAKDSAYPVVNLVNMILLQAIRDGASDVHVEPDTDLLRVRYRIDGVLREVSRLSTELQASFVSRVKTMSGLDISEKRAPQDGRMLVQTGEREIDLRVSTLPTVMGEKVVLRILDRKSLRLRIDDLGFPEGVEARWRDLIRSPDGIVLVTGPTGSGKTSTLYATLGALNSIDRNIVTVEDPVEFHIPLINQVQVNERACLTFPSVLRSILRQDPDIIMLGEIRDQETAEIAVRAALTGHLVLSTLHTNDATSAVTRLVDMGIPPYLVASSVRGVLAQRLVRKICARCRKEAEPEGGEAAADRWGWEGEKAFAGEGCRECGGTGYRGRTGLYELLLVGGPIAREIVRGANDAEIVDEARRGGFLSSLAEDGAAKVGAGITSPAEVLRVTRGGSGGGPARHGAGAGAGGA